MLDIYTCNKYNQKEYPAFTDEFAWKIKEIAIIYLNTY